MCAGEQHSWPWREAAPAATPSHILQDYWHRCLIHSQGTISSSVTGDNTGKTLFTAREATVQNGSGLDLAKICPELRHWPERHNYYSLVHLSLWITGAGDLDSYIQFKPELQLHPPSQTRQSSAFMAVT